MKKICINLTEDEWRFVLHAMNEYRNSLIAEGRYTDTVDDVIVKITKKTPIRKARKAA